MSTKISLLHHQIKITLRVMLRNKLNTIIHIIGLSLGITISLLIFIWVMDELSYNRMHNNIEDIYLVRSRYQFGNHDNLESGSPPALIPAIKQEREEVQFGARIINGVNYYVVRYDSILFKEGFTIADPDIFNIFSFDFIYGHPDLAYEHDQMLVLTERIARKYFGTRNPLGESLLVDNKYEFTVAGVVKNMPHNSTIRFDIWIPIDFTRKIFREDFIDTWYNLAFRSYVLMKPGTDIDRFNVSLKNRVMQSDPGTKISCMLYPFKNQYLILWGGLSGIILFSSIALMILIIACINYINLSTAQAAYRFKEIALKKVSGSTKYQLIIQFITESIMLALIALLISLISLELILPYFNILINKTLAIHYLDNAIHMLIISGVLIFVGLLAGLYPAIQIARIKALIITSSIMGSVKNKTNFRQGLVIFQFALSVIFIISTVVIYRQINFIQSKELGITRDHLIYLPLEGKLKDDPAAFKYEILKNTNFKSATLTSGLPTGIYWNGEGWTWKGKDPNLDPLITYLRTDEDFLETFEIRLKSGSQLKAGAADHALVNETFAELIDEESTIGTMLINNEGSIKSLQIIGIVHDFHFKPLYNSIEPLLIFTGSQHSRYNYLVIKLTQDNLQASISQLKDIYNVYNPDFPFDIHFLDAEFDNLYLGFKKLNTLVGFFAFIGILISCLGLFGLSTFLITKRSKEIGIRKVIGAYTMQITYMLSASFIKYVICGYIIALPFCYFITVSWLSNFAFKTNLSWWIFAGTGLFIIIISFLAVSLQSIKAALKNPVDALRYE